MTESHDSNETDSSDETDLNEGPGWMPAIMAGTVMLGIIGFITCGVTTWLLFQKRTELAVRTLNGTYIPVIEQSLLRQSEKKATLGLLQELKKDLQRGKFENWQAGGVMTRLIRLPVAQWGDLAAVQAVIEKRRKTFSDDALIQLSRLRRATDDNLVTAFDFDFVLEPVTKRDDTLRGVTLTDPMADEKVAMVIQRAKEIADRFQIEKRLHENITIDKIVARQIKAGLESGSM